ncbi:radial spoke head protein 3 homolog A [Prorops nasuta]|uniref:radial spoke head protein 3 homolog A n=1 Tax=Prorops nasuta TaxID=863751 RepID=UPI0034CE1B7B
MPAGISSLAPCTESGAFKFDEKDPPAFTIIQRDGLDCSLPLLHIDGDDDLEDSTIKTENAKNNFYSRRRISKSNDHLLVASLQSNQINPLEKKAYSRSHENLKENDKSYHSKSSMSLSTENFNEVLNAKLRRIQEQEEISQGRKVIKKSSVLSERKPFITTVKTGEFLMPPPEVAALLGITVPSADTDDTDSCVLRSRFKPLVSLGGKRPEVRHSIHNARCQVALKATIDFSLGTTNATSLAASAVQDHNARSKTTFSTSYPRTHRVLPKKLEPIDSTTLMEPKLRCEQAVSTDNMMLDRRVICGCILTSAPAVIGAGDQSTAARHAEARRRFVAKKRIQALTCSRILTRPGSPPPVFGRKHEPVQTEPYLEELFDKPLEYEASTQTDYYLESPPTPVFIPAKVGENVCTQIEPGDLFDYDREVQPILEILVGKTIEQALTEVLEEEEIAALREQQRRFYEIRDAEKAELQRLIEQDRKIREEKERSKREHEEAMKLQRETEERMAAASLLTGYIAELLPSVIEGLQMSGLLLDEIKDDVEGGFMPWLMQEVKKEMGSISENKKLLTEIMREILENRAETYRRLGEEYDASRELNEQDLDEEGGGITDCNFLNYTPPILQDPDSNV